MPNFRLPLPPKPTPSEPTDSARHLVSGDELKCFVVQLCALPNWQLAAAIAVPLAVLYAFHRWGRHLHPKLKSHAADQAFRNSANFLLGLPEILKTMQLLFRSGSL